jgi:hypothetical protein
MPGSGLTAPDNSRGVYCRTLATFLGEPSGSGTQSHTEVLSRALGAALRGTPPSNWQQPCDDFAAFIAFAPRRPLRRLDRWLGMATTPLKMLGIFGWTELPVSASLTGTIVQVAGSTDGFLTIDMKLSAAILGNQMCAWRDPVYAARICPIRLDPDRWQLADRFIRVEAHGHAREVGARRLSPGVTIAVSGTLKIDHDPPGFLELHVAKSSPIIRIEPGS